MGLFADVTEVLDGFNNRLFGLVPTLLLGAMIYVVPLGFWFYYSPSVLSVLLIAASFLSFTAFAYFRAASAAYVFLLFRISEIAARPFKPTGTTLLLLLFCEFSRYFLAP